MILMHDRTYRKRLDEIKRLNELYEITQNQLDKILVQKKDLQYQIDYLMFATKSKQKRINRAIEYIEKRTKETDFDNDKLIDILDILKGSDKE